MKKKSFWIVLALLVIARFAIPAIHHHIEEEEAQTQLSNRLMMECSSVEAIEAGCAEDN